MQVIDLGTADQAQVSRANIPIEWIHGTHLEQAVIVATVDHSECFLGLPLKARADKLKRLLVVKIVPFSAQKIRRKLHVDVPIGCLKDVKSLSLEIDIKLILEVR